MQAPLFATTPLVRPWRTATLVATLVAVLELVALIVLGAMLLARPLSSATRHPAAVRHAHATVPKRLTPVHGTLAVPKQFTVIAAKVPRARTGILVLNGNGRTGAAASESATLHRLGYPVLATGNATRQDYATTVVMYRPGYRAEGIRLARELKLKVVGPLDGLKTAALHGAKLALILGVG